MFTSTDYLCYIISIEQSRSLDLNEPVISLMFITNYFYVSIFQAFFTVKPFPAPNFSRTVHNFNIGAIHLWIVQHVVLKAGHSYINAEEVNVRKLVPEPSVSRSTIRNIGILSY
jgi:hypothetical protein